MDGDISCDRSFVLGVDHYMFFMDQHDSKVAPRDVSYLSSLYWHFMGDSRKQMAGFMDL